MVAVSRIGRWLALASIAWATSACTPTEIVVVVDSDLTRDADGLEGYSISVRGAGPPRCYVVAADDAELPLTLGVAPEGDLSTTRVVAAALGEEVETGERGECPGGLPDGDVLVQRSASASFREGERRVLFLPLRRDCVGVACGTGATCRGGTCEPEGLATEPWEGELPRIGDAGAPPDGGRPDAGIDAAIVRDAGMPDGGTEPSDAGPCPPGSRLQTTTVEAPVADTSLPHLPGCGPGYCGGANVNGGANVVNVGVGRAMLRFTVPGSLRAGFFERVLAARVVLRRAPAADWDCSESCAGEGTLRAWAATSRWSELEAEWCRRNGSGGDGPCDGWVGDGASSLGADVFSPSSAPVDVEPTDDRVTLEVPLEGLAGAAAPGDAPERLSVQIRYEPGAGDPPEGASAVFVFCSKDVVVDEPCTAAPAQLALDHCAEDP